MVLTHCSSVRMENFLAASCKDVLKNARHFVDCYLDAESERSASAAADNGLPDAAEENPVLSASFRCLLCSRQFESLDEQKEHFWSEWHHFNLRRKLRHKPAVTEDDFEDKIADWGSESESSDSDSEEESVSVIGQALSVLKRRPFVYWDTGGDTYAVYKCLITGQDKEEKLACLRGLGNNPVWAIILLAGGRFAAGVFNRQEVVVHKCFHRYTVRRQQGGSQAQRDGKQSQKAPKSAGASLRRYNEITLEHDVRELMEEWKNHLKSASRIFLRVSSFQRRFFFGGKQPVFDKGDSRILSIPFVTHRPVFEEVKRVQAQLSTLLCFGNTEQFYHSLVANLSSPNLHDSLKDLDQLASASQNAAERTNRSKKSPDKSKNAKVKRNKTSPKSGSPEPVSAAPPESPTEIENTVVPPAVEVCEELPRVWQTKIYTACKAGEVTGLQSVINELKESEDFSGDVNCLTAYLNCQFGPKRTTFLQIATLQAQTDMVKFLLQLGCDPTLQNFEGKVPYQLAPSKPVRNCFVDFRAENPTQTSYDWARACVPLPQAQVELTAEQLAKKQEKKREAKKARQERLKERKEEEKRLAAIAAEKERYLALSDREKRALAAERRILDQNVAENASTLSVLSRCFQCAHDITGKIPFEYSDNRFCSIACLKQHRLKEAGTAS